MLSLLNLTRAVLHILHWTGRIDDPYSPDAFRHTLDDPPLSTAYWRLYMFIQNAIEAKEPPALMKPKPKAQEKKLIEKVGVPEEYREMLPKYYDIWITFEDLRTFVERPATISDSSFAHSRDSLARIAWLLAKKAGLSLEPPVLQDELDELVIDLDAQGIDCKLGETPLKGCVREILAAGKSMVEGDKPVPLGFAWFRLIFLFFTLPLVFVESCDFRRIACFQPILLPDIRQKIPIIP